MWVISIFFYMFSCIVEVFYKAHTFVDRIINIIVKDKKFFFNSPMKKRQAGQILSSIWLLY